MFADRSMTIPLYVDIRRGVIAGLAEYLKQGDLWSGGLLAVAVGPGHGRLVEQTMDGLRPMAEFCAVPGPTVDAAQMVVDRFAGGRYDALIGVGGGGTIDVAKYAATQLRLPVVSVATNLAHDGLASPVASLEDHGRKQSFGVGVPAAVLVDLDHVADSPLRQTRSGVGDVISNLSAVADWRLAGRVRGEPVDGVAVSLAEIAARAVLDHPGSLNSDDFIRTLAEALILSGMAMTVAGSSRPCSGACHEISHAIDGRFPGTGTHGEQVAVGAFFALYLAGHPLLDHVDRCFRRHGLTRLPGDLGLTEAQFGEAVDLAPGTRPERWTILEHLDLTAGAIRKHVRTFVATFDR